MKTKIISRLLKLSLTALFLSFLISTVTFAATCYWVGAPGPNNEWDDPFNWSNSSGGSGSTCAATETWPDGGDDTAIFDSGDDEDAYLDINVELDALTINSGYDGIVDMAAYDLIVDDTVTLNDGELQFSSGVLQVGSGDATDDLTIETGATLDGGSGTIDVEGDWNMNGGIFSGGGGNVTIEGDYLQSNGAFNQGSSIVFVRTDFEISTGTYNNTTANLNVDGNLTFSGGTFNGATNNLQGLIVDGNSTISGGDFDLDTMDFAAGDGGDTFHVTGGIVDLGSGTVDIEDNFELSGTGSVTASSEDVRPMVVLGSFYQHGGTFNGNGGTIGVSGSINIASGTFNHGNNSVYHYGSTITGPVTLYDLTSDYAGATYAVNNAITVDNNLQYEDGLCDGSISSKFVIKKDFSWNAGGSGGDCYIELTPTVADSYTFANGDDVPVIYIKDNATVGLTSGSVSFHGLRMDGGILNQGAVNIVIDGSFSAGYRQDGGTFNGGSGSFTNQNEDTRISGGFFNSGTGAVLLQDTTNFNVYDTKDAQVNFNGASSVTVEANLSISNANGLGSVTLTQNTTNVEGSLYIQSALADVSHNNGTIMYKGDNFNVTETLYTLTIDPDIADDEIYTAGTTIVNNLLDWTDGECTSSGIFRVQNDFTYSSDADGGTCQIELTSAGTETVNIVGGTPFMFMDLDSADTTVNLTGSGTSTFYELDIQVGIFNQGAVNLTSNNEFDMIGGTFNGGSGNFTINNTCDIDGGSFTAGSGDIAVTNLYANIGGADFATVDLAISDHVDTYRTSVGATSATGSVTAPYSSSANGWTAERQFIVNYDSVRFDPNGGDITLDGTYSPVIINNSVNDFFNFRVKKGDSANIVQFNTAIDLNGDVIVEKGVMDFDSEAVSLAGNFALCPSAAISDSDCNNAGGSDATLQVDSTVLTLDGAGQTIYGDNSGTFYNLIKTVTSPDTIYFEGGEEVRVTNQLTLTGISNNLLTISSTNSTPAELNAESGMTVDYVKISNVNNTRSGGDYDLRQSAKGHDQNSDLGINNTGWLFDDPYVPASAIPEFSTWIFILTMLIGMGMVQNKFAVIKLRN
ncbi:beta strand repeat-containing protein [Patescibacteria group bacterium]